MGRIERLVIAEVRHGMRLFLMKEGCGYPGLLKEQALGGGHASLRARA
ncbi:hypothetical protein HRbin30_02920 [bacterium HR30]|nr:hypothetical protein HRbin30_02920 [bacterium HR30]